MSEDHFTPPLGRLPEAESGATTARNHLPRGENEGTPGEDEISNEINGLPNQRGPSLYSANGEEGKKDLGKPKPRRELSDYEAAGQANRQQVRDDVRSKAALTSLYCVSHGHFNSMHARAKAEGNEVNPSWCGDSGFACFLIDVGPIPQRDRSLDRIEYDDPEYGPGKVRWATPREQANNRKNTLRVYDPIARERDPLTIVAERRELSAKAMRHRLDRGADPDHVVGEMLLEKAKKGQKTSSGKIAFTPPAELERADASHRADIPTRPPVARINVKTDWPANLTAEYRARWNALYRETRQTNEKGEFEWRFEFFMRTLRGWLALGGFGGSLIGRGPSPAGTELERMRMAWADDEEPTDAEWAAYVARRDFFDRCFSRLREATAALPDFKVEASRCRRDRDKGYPRYGRRDRPSRDHEDDAMKYDENYGHIEADEAPDASNANDWRTDLAEEHAARRRGMEL
ncbi:hypothetical protein GOD78_11000 [Sinorhizobium medicae]|nr:hypothetical protein [Sinorhizobium medicae]MDX0818045.1 hypothetical protein [Sinorhizobium medicae]